MARQQQVLWNPPTPSLALGVPEFSLPGKLSSQASLPKDWPNVKDEPRRELARRVQHYDSTSVVSFRSSFGRTRRDRSRRWLWRLVRRLFLGSQLRYFHCLRFRKRGIHK